VERITVLPQASIEGFFDILVTFLALCLHWWEFC